LGDVTVAARIVDGASTKVFETSEELVPTQFSADGGADFWLQLPVAKLKAGEHLLTITATTRDRSVERKIRFDVRPPY
jgi:hypothetical protein